MRVLILFLRSVSRMPWSCSKKLVGAITKPEESINFGYAASYADSRLSITGSYNYNQIKNFAILDPGQVDSDGLPFTLFSNAAELVTVQGLDVNMSYQLTPALLVTAAAEVFDYRFPAGTLVFARPKAKAYFGLEYEQGPWNLSTKLVVTGPMDLRKFHDDGTGVQNRFNLDGTPKSDTSPTFSTLDVRAEYRLNRMASIYVGADNLLDYKQPDKESQLFVNGEGAPDVVHLWGPSRGRYVYAGVKLSF